MDKDGEGVEIDLATAAELARGDENGPSARAAQVLKILAANGVTNWDAYCFAVEYAAGISLILEHTQPAAKHLARMLYLTHYVRSKDVQWLSETLVSASSPTNQEPTTTAGPSSSS